MNIASVLATKGSSVITIRPGQTVREALALLASHNIGALVVVDDQLRPVGIVSERDIVRAAVRDEDVFGRPIASIMTKEVIIGSPQDDLMSVGNTMTERRIRHLPVVDAGQLVGMVSLGDVVKAQRDKFQGEVDTLSIQLTEEHG